MSNQIAKTVNGKTPKGRGSITNQSSRFDTLKIDEFDDGWEMDQTGPVLRTEFSFDQTRTIIARNTSPDIFFDRSINPYRGCEHGCSYCFARPTHAYLGLSPGLDFETKITVKQNADVILRKALSKPSYSPATIAIGTNTDAYQPAEVKFGIMRGVLKVLRDFNHPVSIVTKGALIRRDIDVLGPMGQKGLTSVGISITTLDPKLSRKLEPRAAAPAMRLKMIEDLAKAGVPVRVMVAPVIPGLTDHELEHILDAAKSAGARSASYIVLRLPLEVSDLFREWLDEHCPSRKDKVIRAAQKFHGGQDYDPEWGKRMTGTGKEADLLKLRFGLATRRIGLRTSLKPLRTDLFAVPGRGKQLDLF